MNKKFKKELFSIVIYTVIVLSLAFIIQSFVFQRTLVDGHSMEEALHDEDQLIISKLSYAINEPKRFDIVVFPYQYDEDTYYIKRIIGLPGEKILIKGNTIYINGEPLTESYGKEAMDEDTAGIAATELLLAEDEYFVMGDNRNNSTDSRSEDVGPVKKEEIIGKAVFRIWPFDDFGFLSK